MNYVWQHGVVKCNLKAFVQAGCVLFIKESVIKSVGFSVRSLRSSPLESKHREMIINLLFTCECFDELMK